jgi:uncharacterized protein (TIGR03437 family)
LSEPAHAGLSRAYGNLPLAFEPNVGQTDPQVRFLARGGGMTAFFTDTETTMVLSRSGHANRPAGLGRQKAPASEVERTVVRMRLENASRSRHATGLEKLPGVSNYFIGNDRTKWRTDVPHCARVRYEGVYPGIDLVWYGNQHQLEYDFVVAAGADPKEIQVDYEGVESVGVEAGGDLVLRTALGEVRQQKPRVYQEVGGKRVEVEAQYAIVARNRVSFELARYDRKRELRIDPVVLVYSTYLGGSGDDVGWGIAVDGAGSAYVTGGTSSTNFPIQAPYQATNQGLYGGRNVFVTKLTPAGNALVYSTYLGGSGGDFGSGIAVDGAGSAYVTGLTASTNFPTQVPYQATFQGGTLDAFVTKLTPAGNALAYSTYLGGSGDDYGNGIAVDGAGSAYVTGFSASANFPTQSPYQAKLNGFPAVFVTKLAPTGNALVYSTYLGGAGTAGGIAVDGAGSAYVTGGTGSPDFPTQSPYQGTYQGSGDVFVTKLMPAGNALAYSTYLGGSGIDYGNGIAVDAAGSAYVTGFTGSTNFPTQSPYQATSQGGLYDAFVTKLTPAGNALVYSTYLGGGGVDDVGRAIAVDGAGSAYVTGWSGAVVAKLALAGNALVYSTYLSGSRTHVGYGIAVDGAGSVYVTGQTESNFPTQSAYQATFQGGTLDAFVAKLSGIGVAASLSLSPSSMAFTATAGQSRPATQTLSVTSTGALIFTATATTTSGGNWLAVTPNSGSTPANLSVSVNPAGMGAGTYSGNVAISSTGAPNSPQSISVALTVTSAPTISVRSSLLNFVYQSGGSLPQAQAVTVAASSPAAFTATASGANWLAVTPNSGTTPANLIISVNPAALNPGIYNGTITVTGTNGAQGTSAINVTLTVTAPLPTIMSVTNAASYATGSVSPGELVTLFGTAIGPATAAGATTDPSTGKLATTIGGVQMLFNGTPAPMIYASSTQVSAVVPYEMASVASPLVWIRYAGQTSNAYQVTSATTAPGLFTQNSSGSGPGAILNQDNSVNGPGNGAARGSIVQVYLTGEGQTRPPGLTGAITAATLPPPQVTPTPVLSVGVTMNGQPALYVYAGEAPGLVAGMMQLNVQIPANAPSGDLQILVSIGGNTSQNGVTVSVQ